MHRLDTSVEINAAAERVWRILMDFPAYGRWNPFVRSIDGDPAVGRALNVFIQPAGGSGMRFQPRVLANETNREFRWKGKVLMPGLLDGEHFYKLEPTSSGVVFHHGEVFSGLLVPLFRKSLEGATRQGFVAMNAALKREAERE